MKTNTPAKPRIKVYVKKSLLKNVPDADDGKKSKKKKGTVKVEKKVEQYEPKVLLYDLETGPNLGYVWGKWEQNVIEFAQEWELLCFAFKWLGKNAITAYAQDTMTEEELVGQLHELIDEADVVIAHNGDRFDQRMANAKFIEFGMDPPSPYRSIDTKKVAARYFRFTSNKLDDLGEKLGVGRKDNVGGFATWLACMEGDQKAWNRMKKYNKQDVALLEDVYLKLRPWIENHPPMNILKDSITACPKCGEEDNLHKRGTRKLNKTTTVQRYQCQSCGGWCQSRHSQKSNVEFVN